MKSIKSKNDAKPPKTAAATRRQVLNELKSLRTVFHDIATRYQTNVEAEILRCMDRLEAKGEEKVPDGARDIKVLQSILTSIEALQLKPREGRLKDIRQIHAVVKKMHDKLCSRQ
ncbi:hypothetical protein JXO59_04195 [candidate division KSB1 bacterium]|nr:hypothetical protein [candidate division KSB1 bacterium]